MIQLILSLLVIISSMIYVSYPLLSKDARSDKDKLGKKTVLDRQNSNLETMVIEQEEILADLEYDFLSGKINAEDYEESKKEIMDKINKLK